MRRLLPDEDGSADGAGLFGGLKMAKSIARRARRGTTMTFSIVVSVVMSGLISTMAWVAGESAQRSGSLSKMDQAFYASEAGLERVKWYARSGQMSSITSPLAGTVN